MSKETWELSFTEKGADIEHDRWARWQQYMFSKGTVDENGVFHLPKEFVDRWFRQIDTKYTDLSEPEKESDRKETRNYIPLISKAIQEAVLEERRRISEALTVDLDMSKMLDGWEKYWIDAESGRFIEGCIECGNSKRIKEALINKDK